MCPTALSCGGVGMSEAREIKRYDIMSNSHDSWFVERVNGGYIKYANYTELEQQNRELIKALQDVLGYAGQEEFIEACYKAKDILNKYKEK